MQTTNAKVYFNKSGLYLVEFLNSEVRKITLPLLKGETTNLSLRNDNESHRSYETC